MFCRNSQHQNYNSFLGRAGHGPNFKLLYRDGTLSFFAGWAEAKILTFTTGCPWKFQPVHTSNGNKLWVENDSRLKYTTFNSNIDGLISKHQNQKYH